jgi:hypothetical protein
MDTSMTDTLEVSHLLSLPKELRLEIWSNTLTDPTIDNPVFRIHRKLPGCDTPGRRSCNLLHCDSGGQVLPAGTSFDGKRSPPGIDILRTNRFIYEEALPILYRSVRFHPTDLEGILPIFLDKLSPFARSHIRHVKLSINSAFGYYGGLFYWAGTCAQLAGLEGLRLLVIEGVLSSIIDRHIRRDILGPLLRVKAPKTFNPVEDARFHELLLEAKRNLEAKVLVRKAWASANSVEEVGRDDVECGGCRDREKIQEESED